MTPKAIHQYAPECRDGDSVTNSMLFIQRLVRAAGIDSDIYCDRDDARLQVLHRDEYEDNDGHLLLVHYRGGAADGAWLRNLAARRVLVFHGVTPAGCFEADDPRQAELRQSQAQLDEWREWLAGAIAVSEKGLDALLEHGFEAAHCAVIPLLVDLPRLYSEQVVPPARPLEDAFRLLFVGHFAPYKNQTDLLESLYHVRRMTRANVTLTLVGGSTDPAYRRRVEQTVERLELQDAVTLAEEADQEALWQHYAQADLYASYSRYEGCGTRLLEAMAHRLPVVAFEAPDSTVSETLGAAGLLTNRDDPLRFAALLATVIQQPRLRRQLVQQGLERLAAFEPPRLYEALQQFLQRLGLSLPAQALADTLVPELDVRIEGPYDGSYSLAMVNRHMAEALGAAGLQVALHSSVGGADPQPHPESLARQPALAQLSQRATAIPRARHVLRLLYPLRLTAMGGRHHGLNAYGWEESALPADTIEQMNRHLHYITSMSAWVNKILLDNGVTAPAFNVGIGADHILEHSADDALLVDNGIQLGSGLRFLHISSCFPRKGVDVLLEAYGQAFTRSDNVTLIIKTFPNPHHDIDAEVAHWRARYPLAAPVVIINRDLPDSAVRALYQQCHVLVAPSRGEGFGLPMAEAMLHDMPVITTGYGGQTDFCREDTAWLLDYEFRRAETHMALDDSVWVEPSREGLQLLLRSFYEARSDNRWEAFTRNRVRAARQLIETQFSWQAVADRLRHAMKVSEELPALLPQPRFGSITTWNTRCGIATYSQLLLTPALDSCWILANDNSELTGTDSDRVIRCWQTGQSDDLDQLLAAIVAKQLQQVLIQFHLAFFNLTTLRRLLGRLHELGIQTFITFHATADQIGTDSRLSLRALLPELADVTRIFVHNVSDLNRLKSFGVVDNVMLFPHGAPSHPPESINKMTPPARMVGKRVIASYGFLMKHKGIHELIEAYALLRPTQPDTHLLLVNALYPGEASHQEAERCREAIARLDLQDHVTMVTDYLPDAESLAWLSLAECIVFPYQFTQESSSAAVRWGLATGKPVLCTPLGIFEDVSDAVTFLPGESPDDIAAGLSAQLSQDEKARLITTERQQRWLDNHSWRNLSQRLRNILMAAEADRLTTDLQSPATKI